MEMAEVGGGEGTPPNAEVQGQPALVPRNDGGSQEEEGKLCTELFPLEIWKTILKYVHDGDKDTLWKCRYVCSDIKKLADEVQKEKATLWKDKLINGKENLGIFLSDVDVKGVWISSEAETIKFIEDMKDCKGSPFPNGTLILGQQCTKGNDLQSDTPAVPHSMLKSLGRLSAVYGEDIICLVYCLPDVCSVANLFLEIGTILTLKNLKSLVLYKRQWEDAAEVAKLYEMAGLPVLGNTISVLKELQLFGRHAWIPFTLILPLFKNAFSRVKDLRTSGAEANVIYQTLVIFTEAEHKISHPPLQQSSPLGWAHLEKLNLMNPKREFVDFILSRTKHQICRNLKEIGLKYMLKVDNGNDDEDVGESPNDSIGQRMSQVIYSLSRRAAASLQWMSINVDRNLLEASTQSDLELKTPITAHHQFVELKHLTINLSTVFRWSHFVKELTTKKMPNLKEVKVLIFEEEDLEWETLQEFLEFVNNVLWDLFPSSVEVIRVPWFSDWEMRKNQNEPSGSS